MNETEWRQFKRVVERTSSRLGDPSGTGGIETIRSRMETLWSARSPLGYLIDADFNSTADQVITIHAALWIPLWIVARYKSGTFTSAAGGVYTEVSKGGTAIVAATQAYATLDDTGDAKQLTLAVSDRCFSIQTVYLSLTTAAGAAALADVYVFGLVLPTS